MKVHCIYNILGEGQIRKYFVSNFKKKNLNSIESSYDLKGFPSLVSRTKSHQPVTIKQVPNFIPNVNRTTSDLTKSVIPDEKKPILQFSTFYPPKQINGDEFNNFNEFEDVFNFFEFAKIENSD